MNIVIPPASLALAEALNVVTPDPINSFFFSNSGAEAVEAAVKLAKHATGRTNIIVFQGSFHGRTAQTMAMTSSKTIYRHVYQPLPSGIFVAPFPSSYFFGWDDEETIAFCMRQLDLLLKAQTSAGETAAVIIEPVQGEGGYIPAPPGFLQELRLFCDDHDILLVVDEIQSGFGRTGKFFAYEHAGIEPDIIIMAKGLGSGMPISAIASRRELMKKWETGSHGGTYGGGGAIPSAAARATVEVIREEGLVENADQMGTRLMNGLRALQQRYPVIGDVRGLGLMVATKFTGADGNSDAETASAVATACIEQRLLMLTCGSYKNVIRWIPPLVVKAEQIDEALNIFEKALRIALG